MPESYDLVVVGTGFASSFFLKRYLENAPSNQKVLVLERGEMLPYLDRLKAKQGTGNIDPRKAGSTYQTDSDKIWVFDPNFGGSSNCWTGCTPRFLPNDFELRSKYGVGQDWPISYDDIGEYYEEAEQIMSIAGPGTTPFPKSNGYPLPPHALSTVDKLLQEKYQELYISQPTARASQAVGSRGNCCSSSVCDLCPVNAKFTIENGLGQLYDDDRVTLKYNAQAIGLETANDTAKSITYVENGVTQKAFGETFVLGANGVFNSHILLNSGDTNPLTGAGICEQIGVFARLYYKGLSNVGGGSIITANGYMMYDGEHRKDHAACIIESFNTPFIRNEVGKWRDMSIFKFIFEDIPQNSNKVTLSGDERIPNIAYESYSDYVQKGMDQLPSLIDQYFGFLPVEKVEIDGYAQKTEFHICSTTRMGNSSEDSVIDANLVHHQFRNVIVSGSSVYPSITPANPTLTLSALSLRAANRYFG